MVQVCAHGNSADDQNRRQQERELGVADSIADDNSHQYPKNCTGGQPQDHLHVGVAVIEPDAEKIGKDEEDEDDAGGSLRTEDACHDRHGEKTESP